MLTPRGEGKGLRASSAVDARVTALGLVALSVGVALLVSPDQPAEPELFTQWLFNYGCGLVKRALVGDMLARFVFAGPLPITASAMHAVATNLSVATALLFALFSARVWVASAAASRTARVQTLLAVLLLSVAPVGAVYYAGARQYQEVCNLLLLALFAHAAATRALQSTLPALAVLLSLVSTLIHESSLLSTTPVMLTLAVMQTPDGPQRRRAIVAAAGAFALCTALVLYVGAATTATAACITSQLTSRLAFPVDPSKVEVLTSSFTGNVWMTLRAYVDVDNGSRVLLSLVVAAPAMLFLAASLRRRDPGRTGWWLVAVGLLPFGLIPLADDVYRWFVLSVVGLSVLLLSGDRTQERPVEDTRVLALGIAALVIAVVVPFPFFWGASSNPLFHRMMALVHLL